MRVPRDKYWNYWEGGSSFLAEVAFPYLEETVCLRRNEIQRKAEPRNGESSCPDDFIRASITHGLWGLLQKQ